MNFLSATAKHRFNGKFRMYMQTRLKTIAIFGATAVIFGAFGAHGLQPLLDENQMNTYKTASFYHFVHTLLLSVLHFSMFQQKVVGQSFKLLVAGICCFSGSLYILACKHLIGGDVWNFVGPVTPIGGVLLVLAWLNLGRIKATTLEK